MLTFSALDAAQIGFEGGPSEIRLDPDDAVFIDCHHTNAKPTIPFFGLGFMRKIGNFNIIYLTQGNVMNFQDPIILITKMNSIYDALM